MSERDDNPRANLSPLDAEVDPTVVAAEAKRVRTFHRWIVAIVICFIALIAAPWRFMWGHAAKWRLQAEIDKIVASGEPLFREDFPPPEVVQDEENAAALYRKAYAGLVQKTNARITLEEALFSYTVAYEVAPDDTAIILAANKEPLRLIRQARSMPKADWGDRFANRMIEVNLSRSDRLDALADLAQLNACYHHHLGNDAGAIENIFDAIAIADKTPQPGTPFILDTSHVGILWMGITHCIGHITPTLQIEAADSQTATEELAAPREKVFALIHALLNKAKYRSNLETTLRAERAYALETVQSGLDGEKTWLDICGIVPLIYAPPSVLDNMKPMFFSDTRRMLRRFDCLIMTSSMEHHCEAAKTAEEPIRISPGLEWLSDEAGTVDHLMTCFPAVVCSRFRLSQWQLRGMAATALAIRLYETDHGHRPATLDELVPTYLEPLPEDPYAEDCRTFGYTTGEHGPYLYSVGKDHKDDQGKYYIGRGCSNCSPDYPFFLSVERPRLTYVLKYIPQQGAYQILPVRPGP